MAGQFVKGVSHRKVHYSFDRAVRIREKVSMPRKIRVEYPGAIYHVLSRGDRRDDIFLDDVDRQDFLKTLAEACQKTGWQVVNIR